MNYWKPETHNHISFIYNDCLMSSGDLCVHIIWQNGDTIYIYMQPNPATQNYIHTHPYSSKRTLLFTPLDIVGIWG